MVYQLLEAPTQRTVQKWFTQSFGHHRWTLISDDGFSKAQERPPQLQAEWLVASPWQRSCTSSHHPFHWCFWGQPFGCPCLLAWPRHLELENALGIEKTWSKQWMNSLPSWKTIIFGTVLKDWSTHCKSTLRSGQLCWEVEKEYGLVVISLFLLTDIWNFLCFVLGHLILWNCRVCAC